MKSKKLREMLILSLMVALCFTGCETNKTPEDTLIKDGRTLYEDLNDADRELYDVIYTNIVTLSPSFSTSVKDEEKISEIYGIIIEEHPELIYSNGYLYTVDNNRTTVTLNYAGELNDCLELSEYFESLVEQVSFQGEGVASEYEVAKSIFDNTVSTVRYTANQDEFAKDMLITGCGTSKELASIYSKACIDKGIDSLVVKGTLNNVETYWSLIKLEEEWYLVDVASQIVNTESTMYTYFCVSPYAAAHYEATCKSTPECTSANHNPQNKNGLYFTAESVEEIGEKIREHKDDSSIALQFSTEEQYEDIVNKLIAEQKLSEYIDATNVFVKKDGLNLILEIIQ